MRTAIAVMVLAALFTTAPPAVQAQTTKVESKVEQAKDKTKSATGEAKAAVTDSWITSKAKIALFADERVKGTQVSVATTDGVVRLSGKVDSQEAKAAAADVAKGIEGVKSVRNDLQVVSPGARKAVEASDKDITKTVESRLAKDAQLKKIERPHGRRGRDADGRGADHRRCGQGIGAGSHDPGREVGQDGGDGSLGHQVVSVRGLLSSGASWRVSLSDPTTPASPSPRGTRTGAVGRWLP